MSFFPYWFSFFYELFVEKPSLFVDVVIRTSLPYYYYIVLQPKINFQRKTKQDDDYNKNISLRAKIR